MKHLLSEQNQQNKNQKNHRNGRRSRKNKQIKRDDPKFYQEYIEEEVTMISHDVKLRHYNRKHGIEMKEEEEEAEDVTQTIKEETQ